MDLEALAGWSGAIIILVFYFLDLFHVLSDTSPWYRIGNIVGAVLLLITAALISAYPFVVVNAAWIVGTLVTVFVNFKFED